MHGVRSARSLHKENTNFLNEYKDTPGLTGAHTCQLIRRGRPDFVEIKGVTFTGGNKPELGMSNVPWHAEVVAFAKVGYPFVASVLANLWC